MARSVLICSECGSLALCGIESRYITSLPHIAYLKSIVQNNLMRYLLGRVTFPDAAVDVHLQ